MNRSLRRGGRVTDGSTRNPAQAACTPWGRPPPHVPASVAERAALEAVYARVDESLRAVSGRCRVCGRCCRFEPGGVVLFASALELACLVSMAGPPAAALTDPDCAGWVCPYQAGDVCGVRRFRLLGCRTYFCDADARAAGEQVYADALAELRRISAVHGRSWWYGPASEYLLAAASAEQAARQG